MPTQSHRLPSSCRLNLGLFLSQKATSETRIIEKPHTLIPETAIPYCSTIMSKMQLPRATYVGTSSSQKLSHTTNGSDKEWLDDIERTRHEDEKDTQRRELGSFESARHSLQLQCYNRNLFKFVIPVLTGMSMLAITISRHFAAVIPTSRQIVKVEINVGAMHSSKSTMPIRMSVGKHPAGNNISFLDDEIANEQQQNKSLVIMMGNLRGGEQAWETLYTNVLDENAADLALIIGDENSLLDLNLGTSLSMNNSSLLKRARYVWTFPEYDDWADAVDLINGSEWRDDFLPHISAAAQKNGIVQVLGGIKGTGKGSGAIIFMVRWFLSQQLIKDPAILKQYERFVITRSDHYYQCPHLFRLLDLGNNTMWIPEGSDFGGYTDRHLVVSRENIFDALDIFPALLRDPSIIFSKNLTGFNPEQLLKHIWTIEKNLKVKYFPRVMFTSAIASDKTRWRKAAETVPGVPGLLKKYPEEYDLAQAHCQIAVENSTHPKHIQEVSRQSLCQQPFFRGVIQLKKHLSTLDLWVVSHGEVGSDYLTDYLESQGLELGKKKRNVYQTLRHLGNKEMVDMVWNGENPPVLVIIGDIWHSLLSQHRRNWLRMNVAKTIFGQQQCALNSYTQYLSHNPNDPAGIKSMIKAFMAAKNAVFLKAPYTKDSVVAALKLLGLDDVNLMNFMVNNHTSNADIGSVAELKGMYAPYKKLHSFINGDKMPECWTLQSLPKRLVSHLQSLIDS